MRPLAGTEGFRPRSRKSSITTHLPAGPPDEALNDSPVTYFLRRGSHGNETDSSATTARKRQSVSPVETLNESLDNCPNSPPTAVAPHELEDALHGSRRRSTIKAKVKAASQGSPLMTSRAPLPEPSTPPLVPSETSSFPSSPKSTSTRSLRPSDIGSIGDDSTGQAIMSSGDEEAQPGASSEIQEAAPQLIMPSIKMPSRRPFTKRGKEMGNFKILIAGGKGIGKSSLIKSIVQTCEDIVHVDPTVSSKPLAEAPSSRKRRPAIASDQPQSSEIHASTKPYPTWWSEIEDSRMLRRRRTLGDTILDRNLCFVDIESQDDLRASCDYIMMQLVKAIKGLTSSAADFTILCGGGGPQVDVVLYLVSRDTLEKDLKRLRVLSDLTNVIPLIAKADLLAPDEIGSLKSDASRGFDIAVLGSLPSSSVFSPEQQVMTAPYTVSSATTLDDTMDASMLMSPDYVQPLCPSELKSFVNHLFEPDTMAYFRHSSAKKLVAYTSKHPEFVSDVQNGTSSLTQASPRPSSLGSPSPSALSASGILVRSHSLPSSPLNPDVAANNLAMVRLAENTQQEERLAQVRLTKWAADLQASLQRERERYERLARGEHAAWLVERMGEAVRDGKVTVLDPHFSHPAGCSSLVRTQEVAQSIESGKGFMTDQRRPYPNLAHHDPLGLVRWSADVRTRGLVVLQVISGFGVAGGIAFWLARASGLTSAVSEFWTSQGWSFAGVCGRGS